MTARDRGWDRRPGHEGAAHRLKLPTSLEVAAVAPYWGRVRDLIKALKYDGETQHAAYLGHLLFRHLDRHFDPAQVDLILPNPTHAHRGVRHTELLVDAMARADTHGRWTFDEPFRPVLVKSRATVRAQGQDERGRLVAAEALARSLRVARPEVVTGRRLLVVDDVKTTGSQLAVLAQLLEAHGARQVKALVLATSAPPSLGPPNRDATVNRPPGADGLGRLDALRRTSGPTASGLFL